MESHWDIILDFGTLAGFLLLASIIQQRVSYLRNLMMPISIVAGFLCLFSSGQFLGLVEISSSRLGTYVYHLLPLTFIAMGLRGQSSGQDSKAILSNGLMLSIAYSTQVFIGMLVVTLYLFWVSPDLFPNFGYLLFLGFGQGPGQALSLGKSWEPLGLSNGGSLGLTFAAIGYLWATIPGVLLVSKAAKKRKSVEASDLEKAAVVEDHQIDETKPAGEPSGKTMVAIDELAYQIAWVLFLYVGTYGLLKAIEVNFLTANTKAVTQIKSTLWGTHFIVASILSIIVRKVLNWRNKSHLINNELMTKIAGTCLDFMVISAIAAISLQVFLDHWRLILITTTFGGLTMIFLIYTLLKQSGLNNKVERFAALYGTITGTLSTGLTLNRMVDPKFKTPAGRDVFLGTAIAVPFTLPLIASTFIPILGMNKENPLLYYLGDLAIIGIYTLMLYIAWRFLCSKRKDTVKSQI